MSPRRWDGAQFWVGLPALVAAVEVPLIVTGRRTPSQVHGEAITDWRLPIVAGVWAVMFVHLWACRLPGPARRAFRHVDPFTWFARAVLHTQRSLNAHHG